MGRVVALGLAVALSLPWLADAAVKEKKGLKIGAILYAKDSTQSAVKELTKYVGKAAKMPAEAVFFNGYEEIVKALDEKAIDLAVLTPLVFVKVKAKGIVEPLAIPVIASGLMTYRSSILVRKNDTARKALKDLEGCKFGFVDKLSSSGYAMPRVVLEQAGVKLDSIKEEFLGNHIDAVKALKEGKVDATATFAEILDIPELKDLADQFEVIGRSDPIPNDVVVAGNWVDEKTRARIKEHLLDFHYLRRNDSKLKKLDILAFVPADPNLYSALEKLSSK